MKQKNKTRNLITVILSVLCAALIALGISFALPKNGVKSAKAAVPTGELWDGKNFDGNALNDLFEVLIGKQGATIKDVESAGLLNAANFRTNNGGTDIEITIAGKKWTPVYLFNAEASRIVDNNVKDGDAILTLLMTDSDITSKWAAFGSTDSSKRTPCSMYSTSYIRAEVLNAGGGYATGTDDDFSNLPVKVTKKDTEGGNTFAKFTSESCVGNLTKYIVKPQNIEYQATENACTLWQYNSTLANDAYEAIAQTDWKTNGNFTNNNYQDKVGYAAWSNDYIWLPSMAELGDGSKGAEGGIWKTSQNQRYYNNKTTYTRSAGSNNVNNVYAVKNTYLDTGNPSGCSYYVRPAFHLNLTEAAGIVLPQSVEVEYNGVSQTLADVSADQKKWFNSNWLTVTPTSTMQNAGTYSIKVELTAQAIADGQKFCSKPDTSKGETATVRYIDFKIKKKPLDATLTESDGVVTLTVDPSGLCGTDSLPTTAIQYTSTDGRGYNSTTAPAQKGEFKAEPVITSANSNYSLNCQPESKTFTINAIKVDLPALPPTAVPEYDGTSQTIALSNYTHNGKGVNIFSVSGKTASGKNIATAPTFNTATGEVTFKDAGTYTVTFTLEDTVNCEWRNGGGNGQKPINFTVKPKQLTVAVTNDNGDLWNWGIGTAVNATVTVSDIISGDNVTLTTSYATSTGISVPSSGTANGGATSVSDTLNLPANLVQDTYTLNAEIDNENYSIADGLVAASMPLNFTIGAVVFDPDAFTWTYAENGTGTNAIKDGDNFLKYQLDAAGNPYEYKLSINLGKFVSVFQTLTDTDYTDHKQTNAGTYTTTVRLKIRNSDYSFDLTKTYTNATVISTTEADVVIHWTVEKGDFVDLDKLPWVYRDGTSGSWVDYTDARPPEYSGKTITVRLKGDVNGTLHGLKPAYGAHDAEKDINSYALTVKFSVTDTQNFNVPADITFNWKITKKIINVQWEPDVAITYNGTQHPEWQGNEYYATQLRYDKPEYADKVEYIYSCTLPDGSTYTGRGDEALAYITEQALAASQKIVVEVEVELKSDATTQNSYDIVDTTGGDFKTTFVVGDSKIVAKVELTTSGEYSDFNYNLTVTGEDMDSGKYTVTVYKGTNISDPADPANTLITNFDPKTADAGKYFVVVELTGDWGDEYRLSGKIKTFEILPKSVDLPTLNDVIFTGGNIDLINYMSGFDANLMEFVAGGDYEGLRNVSEHGYTVQIRITNPNYRWNYDGSSKVVTGYSVSDYEINKFDDTTATYNWNIAPLVIDASKAWNKGKNGATLNLPQNVKDLISAGTLELGYKYYDTEGNFIENPEIKGNKQFKVEAVFGGEDAERNVQFKTGDTTIGNTSPAINYTVPQSGAAAFFGNALSFLKNNWWWLLIALAVLIFLIILIVVLVKRRKNKEEREEKKRQKEEEKERREEEKR
ncbi:MAG: hypothetical protein K2O41_03170, partial [Clostridia bacterium]|nr:hypothetical protein [Clostridia bacterium]